jgi:hypothetical protein
MPDLRGFSYFHDALLGGLLRAFFKSRARLEGSGLILKRVFRSSPIPNYPDMLP